MKKLLPIIMAVVGLGAGLGAGILLKPNAAPAEVSEEKPKAETKDAGHHGSEQGSEIASLENQFIVPVLENAEVAALVVLSIDLEVETGASKTVHKYEPKLRDAFLRVLFDHANSGGFDGAFTSAGTMGLLRQALVETAEKTLGDIVETVLITDLLRQDM